MLEALTGAMTKYSALEESCKTDKPTKGKSSKHGNGFPSLLLLPKRNSCPIIPNLQFSNRLIMIDSRFPCWAFPRSIIQNSKCNTHITRMFSCFIFSRTTESSCFLCGGGAAVPGGQIIRYTTLDNPQEEEEKRKKENKLTCLPVYGLLYSFISDRMH